MEEIGKEAQKNTWKAAIPLLVHLHDSEITSLPPPNPLVILAPRLGYLPLIAPQLKACFSSTLPPGDDTVWFDYKGMPLKWYIPTGVLFDLLCAEPESPWKLTVHFRGYPSHILTPCEGEDAVKWNFINSLKEAVYIMSGNCKSIMNMSQSDQSALWRSVLDGNLEGFLKVTSNLKLGVVEDKYVFYPSFKPPSTNGNIDNTNLVKTGKIPIRLYVRTVLEVFDDLEDVPEIDSWESVSCINRPIEFDNDEGTYMTLGDAMKTLLPEYFTERPENNETTARDELIEEHSGDPIDTGISGEGAPTVTDSSVSIQTSTNLKVGLIRIHRCEPPLNAPLSWVVNNLMFPDHFLHICVYLIHKKSSFRRVIGSLLGP
ncbi:autophagy protein 5-like [Silene latifolia]|uniref:autophagy protein 5-like n=1 Tax=Silene latifolia TaxID=37657 RepID=UPI003D786966